MQFADFGRGQMLKVSEVAERLGVNDDLVNTWIVGGLLAHARIGRMIRVPESAVDELDALYDALSRGRATIRGTARTRWTVRQLANGAPGRGDNALVQ